MDLFTAIAERRSVKKFDPDHRLTDAEINRLMEAVIQSPTSFNIQNWRFVLVTDSGDQAADPGEGLPPGAVHRLLRRGGHLRGP